MVQHVATWYNMGKHGAEWCNVFQGDFECGPAQPSLLTYNKPAKQDFNFFWFADSSQLAATDLYIERSTWVAKTSNFNSKYVIIPFLVHIYAMNHGKTKPKRSCQAVPNQKANQWSVNSFHINEILSSTCLLTFILYLDILFNVFQNRVSSNWIFKA